MQWGDGEKGSFQRIYQRLCQEARLLIPPILNATGAQAELKFDWSILVSGMVPCSMSFNLIAVSHLFLYIGENILRLTR